METPFVQVIGPTDQWILERLARRLVAKLPYAEFVPFEPSLDVSSPLAYYMNYALFHRKTRSIDVGFFTHREDDRQFLDCAAALDHAVCMAQTYADWLRARGLKTVTHIPTGFDFYRFRPRLVVGVVGLLQHPRKGKHLVDQVRTLDFVEVRSTEGALQEVQLRDFYQALDFVLIPATIEGGPMCLLEGLGSGRPVIAPDDVGMVPEFPRTPYIRRYPTGNWDALVNLLRKCYQEKCWSQHLVSDRTWDDWAESHDRLFRRLLRERGIRFPDPAPGFRFGMMRELKIPPTFDVTKLEMDLDRVAARLYYGRYAEAKSILSETVSEFPFASKLLETIPV